MSHLLYSYFEAAKIVIILINSRTFLPDISDLFHQRNSIDRCLCPALPIPHRLLSAEPLFPIGITNCKQYVPEKLPHPAPTAWHPPARQYRKLLCLSGYACKPPDLGTGPVPTDPASPNKNPPRKSQKPPSGQQPLVQVVGGLYAIAVLYAQQRGTGEIACVEGVRLYGRLIQHERRSHGRG